MHSDDSDQTTPQDSAGDASQELFLRPGDRLEQFTIRQMIGRGGFGVVFLAYDETLRREVALKVPHAALLKNNAYAKMYLDEARAIAALDHPNIIPAYHAGSTAKFACYIVTKFIAGEHLGKWIRDDQIGFRDIANITALVADALAYAHSHGIVHRDIKPSNVLIDLKQNPFVVDFGLALRDAEHDDKVAYIGTPPYMSPEQARGEGHRVDGRSDIFSLGVVLYELITRQRPFQDSNRANLYHKIQFEDPLAPKQLRRNVPTELERICLKCLSKSVKDRYENAAALADDLFTLVKRRSGPARNAVLHSSIDFSPPIHGAGEVSTPADGEAKSEITLTDVEIESRETTAAVENAIPIVPKGLRSFDFRDAEFFLQLLPGPRDREGIPEVIRFWKSRIEPNTQEASPSVGVLFGPSGCGKSSLVRAGIMPRLSSSVNAIYIEATAGETEESIIDTLSQQIDVPALTQNRSAGERLVHTFTWLRRNSQRKTVFFVDQFEQWLFAHADLDKQSLTMALRQCDGVNLQCILMVRDDFWMGVTRLMQLLDLTITEHQNGMAVDLFDKRHAKKVLAMFGAAYGRLNADPMAISNAENRFLDAAINYLAADGRVVCVQLALLAEIMKNRPWNTREISFEDGGLGLGVRFLEDTFDSDSSQRRHHLHAEGAARILRRLLPESISRIKGAMHTEQELLDACSYSDRNAFRELLYILDNELHLITPTDRVTVDSFSAENSQSSIADTGYQLTHDFLITPIHQWLEIRNLGTRTGQAQARLEEYAEIYRARPKPKSLPTMMEYFLLRRRIRPNVWTEPQKRMMNAAHRLHARNFAITLVSAALFLTVLAGGWQLIQNERQKLKENAEIERFLAAELETAIVQANTLRQPDRQYARMQLATIAADEATEEGKLVRASLALTPEDNNARQHLTNFVLNAETSVQDVVLICTSQSKQSWLSEDELVKAWSDKNAPPGKRLRAACGLVQTQSTIPIIEQHSAQLVSLLINENSLILRDWLRGFAKCSSQMIAPLVAEFGKSENNENTAVNIAIMLGAFGRDQPELLANMISDAAPNQLKLLVNSLKSHPDGSAILERLTKPPNANDAWSNGFHVREWWGCEPPDFENKQKEFINDNSVQSLLRKYSASIGPACILVHRISKTEFESLDRKLRLHCFRLTALTTYTAEGANHLMAVWHQDGRNARYTIDATAEELRAINHSHRSENFFPVDVSAHSFDNCNSFVYNCVWCEGPLSPIVIDADMYIEVPASRHSIDGWQSFAERGYIPRCNLTTQSSQGEEAHTSIRWKLREPYEYEDKWNSASNTFAIQLRCLQESPLLHSKLSNRLATDTQRGMDVIWWNGIPARSHWLDYRTADEHRRESERLFSIGYRPVSIDVTQRGEDPTPLYSSTWWVPHSPHSIATEQYIKQSRRLIALFLLDKPQQLAAAMSNADEPELRANLIDAFSRHDLAQSWLVEQLISENQPIELRRAAALALALYTAPTMVPSEFERFSRFMADPKQNLADAGLRSAIEAICTRWSVAKPNWNSTEDQFWTQNGQRMITLHPRGAFVRGSPLNEPRRDHRKERPNLIKIKHPYALSDREVTIKQFTEFAKACSINYEYATNFAQHEDCPAIEATWFLAAKYCRWLSELEELPENEMCYPRIADIEPGMSLPSNFLERRGYRLPTEAEFEYACRANSSAARHFGFAPHLLNQYAWTSRNAPDDRAQPVGRKLPNDFGFFDLLGNTKEWCQDPSTDYPSESDHALLDDPIRSVFTVDGSTRRINRGGAFLYQQSDARSAHRDDQAPQDRRPYMSFRVARTIIDKSNIQ